MDQDASKSALNYLLQEVSKLAPPIHHTPSTTEGRVALCQPSGSLCQRGPPCVSPHKRIRMDKCHSKTGSMLERRGECYSPWRVLSLINLQCERLLHQRDVEECDPTSASYTIVFGQSANGSGETGAAGTHQGVGDGCYCIECTLKEPLICGRQEISACVDPIEDFEVVDESCEPPCFGLKFLPQSSEKQCVSNSELAEEDASVSSQPTQRNDGEVKFRCPAREEQAEQVDFSTKPDVFSLPIPENDMSPKHLSDASLQLTFNASISVSGPAFILDHNANIVVRQQPPCDHDSPLLRSHSDSPSFSTEEGCQLLSEPLDQIASKTECARLTEEESPAVAPLTPSSDHEAPSPSPSTTVKSEPSLAEEEDGEEEEEEEEGSNLPCTHQTSSKFAWRSKTPRKQANPSRSANVEDPHFQGVTFRMDTELDDSKEQCRLLITSKYSKELNKGARKPKLRIRTAQRSPKVCCSEEEGDPTNTVSRGKVCASCCTKKTPMWRDAEDGTPLCNACGIRYKKYRVRCVNCWHIPRKEGNSNSCCLKCGNFVQLTSTQRKHTT